MIKGVSCSEVKKWLNMVKSIFLQLNSIQVAQLKITSFQPILCSGISSTVSCYNNLHEEHPFLINVWLIHDKNCVGNLHFFVTLKTGDMPFLINIFFIVLLTMSLLAKLWKRCPKIASIDRNISKTFYTVEGDTPPTPSPTRALRALVYLAVPPPAKNSWIRPCVHLRPRQIRPR